MVRHIASGKRIYGSSVDMVTICCTMMFWCISGYNSEIHAHMSPWSSFRYHLVSFCECTL